MNTAGELVACAYLHLKKECDGLKQKLGDACVTINRLTKELSQEKHAHTATQVKNLEKLEAMIKLEDEIRVLKEENRVFKHKNAFLVEKNMQLYKEKQELADEFKYKNAFLVEQNMQLYEENQELANESKMDFRAMVDELKSLNKLVKD